VRGFSKQVDADGERTAARPFHLDYDDYRRHERSVLRSRALVWGTIAVGFAWGTWTTGFGVVTFVQGIRGTFGFIFTDMLPPRLEAAPQFVGPMLDTLYMSYVGMLISVVISLPLGVLGARNTTVNRALGYASRMTTSFIRAAPELILAIFLVAIFGIGPLAGTIAMGIGGVGVLGKAYADAIEGIDMQQIEGIRAAGGTWLQSLGQGVWPQFRPAFITWSLYRLDMNIREAAMLGLVGAGGLGHSLMLTLRLFQFRTATTIILMIFALILIVEVVTGALRRRAL
jgi:phosphonate transport system permease protein